MVQLNQQKERTNRYVTFKTIQGASYASESWKNDIDFKGKGLMVGKRWLDLPIGSGFEPMFTVVTPSPPPPPPPVW